MQVNELGSRLDNGKYTVCIVGLGYVGLPLFIGFSMETKTIGFDVSQKRVSALQKGIDESGEMIQDEINFALKGGSVFTSDQSMIKEADFIIICVPTPILETNLPDLKYVISAGEIVGKNMKRGCVVVLESTVYPGVTEDVLGSALERASGMRLGEGFVLGYSPERINPGDKKHGLSEVIKVVGGSDEDVTNLLAKFYGKVAKAGVFEAKDIKTAEAAKVIENIQRDLNIALVNELSIIFSRMGLDTLEVLKAAETKWNFHSYRPGLVGGHCIPVDPYYLVHAAKKHGYDPKVILAGRDINNYMPLRVVELITSSLNSHGRSVKGSSILLMGLTFKKNVKDTRNSPSSVVVKELKKLGANLFAFDPIISRETLEGEFGIRSIGDISEAQKMDCIVMITDHDIFREIELAALKGASSEKPILVDVRRLYDENKAKDMGFSYVAL